MLYVIQGEAPATGGSASNCGSQTGIGGGTGSSRRDELPEIAALRHRCLSFSSGSPGFKVTVGQWEGHCRSTGGLKLAWGGRLEL